MSQKPRILLLSTAYLPLIGGSEIAIRNVTDRLLDDEFDMVTGRYASQARGQEQVGRVRVFRAGGRLSRLTLVLPKLLMPLAMAITAARLMRTHRYALVHAWQASQGGAAAAILKILYPRVPLIVTLQEGKELEAQSLAIRLVRGWILRSADRITAISSHLAGYARRFSRAPVDIVPNGVDAAGLAPAGSRPASPEPLIISVSRLVEKNGIANLIRALPLVRARIPARLMLVGDGALRQSLSRLAADLGVADRVDFAGTVPHERLALYLHQADVFVRPSLSEGLGNAFLEAMAAGVPVVGSRVGGIADFLEHEQTGLVCDPANPADIASQIIRMLSDEPLRERMTAQALAMVRERFDWSVVADLMAGVYRTVMH